MKRELQIAGDHLLPYNEIARTDLTLRDLWRMLLRRKIAIFSVVCACVLVAILACIFIKPQYQASEVIQIRKEGSGPLGLDRDLGQDIVSSDTLDYNITLQTQASILQSDTLALKTIESLDLENSYNYRPKFSVVGWALSWLAPKSAGDPGQADLEQSPKRMLRVLKVWESHFKVKVSDGTRLITITYTDPDPKLAAAVLNRLVEFHIEYDYQLSSEANAQGAKWLTGQLSTLKDKAEIAQAKVAKLQQDAQVYSIGDVDQNGRVQSVSVVLSKLQDLSSALSTAETNRILKEAVYRAVQGSGADAISGLAGNILSGASSEVANSMTVLQGLRTQQAAVQATYAEQSAKFGTSYPRVQQLQAQLDELDHSIQGEVARIAARARTDYEIARQTEENTQQLFRRQKSQADTLNSKAIEYTLAKQEAEQSQGLYQDLYKRLQEAGALQSLRSSNVSIVDPARVPGRPKLPNPPLFLGAAVVGGLLLGAAYALLRDQSDQSVLTISQVEQDLSVFPLGVLPSFGESAQMPRLGALKTLRSERGGKVVKTEPVAEGLYCAEHPGSSYAEALRMLRTSILLSKAGGPSRVLLVTSSMMGEGKSKLSRELGTILGQQGHRVLVVECDMRRPRSQYRLGSSPEAGLSTLLSDVHSPDPIHPLTETKNVFFLPAGAVPPYPTELLGSNRMEELLATWRKEYAFVVLDSPPALAVADALILTKMADLILMLVRHKFTTRQAMLQTYRILNGVAEGKHVGVVVNAVQEGSRDYKDYYGYSRNAYGTAA